MRRNRLLTLVFVVAVLASACLDGNCSQGYSPTPVPSPTASPSPSPSPTTTTANCVDVERLRIATGATSCTVQPGNVLTVGCTVDITATPLLADQSPAPLSVHGPDVAWSGAGPIVALDERGTNVFNRRVRALARGQFVVNATNCGRTGEFRGEVS